MCPYVKKHIVPSYNTCCFPVTTTEVKDCWGSSDFLLRASTSFLSMAEEEEVEVVAESNLLLQPSNPPPPPPPPRFVEVTCTTSGKVRRFAVGTEAKFALYLINRKLGIEFPPVSYIEAVKEGEEPISFGPNCVLNEYGDGWKLQTFKEKAFIGKEKETPSTTYKQIPTVMMARSDVLEPVGRSTTNGQQRPDGVQSVERSTDESKPHISLPYIGKIMLALVLIFLIGAFFTLFLESLPGLILFITSSM